MDLTTPVKDAGRAFKQYASRLEKLGITKLGDFLYHFPFRYDDYSLISKIAQVQPGETVTIQGTVISIENIHTKSWKKLQKAVVSDETGTLEVVWFNLLFITKIIKAGDTISLSGKVEPFGNKLTMQSPEYEVIYEGQPPIHTGRLVPIYPETQGVSSKWLRRQVHKLLQETATIAEDHLPDSTREAHGLLPLTQAITHIHFPKDYEQIAKAKERLGFDELFLLHLSSIHKRHEWEKYTNGNPFIVTKHQPTIDTFIQKLPFELTNAQQQALNDIFVDLQQKKPMNRLLEGDVGSGKTVVAAIAMYLTHLNGFQSVLMAPTEILAQQHFATIKRLLLPFNVTVHLRTGSMKTKTEDPHILIGTHAVIGEQIHFDNLGLVVIDEQQRFGVEQRAILRQKGKNPHILTMTATPIPRTIALTMYGDLDLSYLHEMPKSRKRIKTWLVPEEKRDAGYEWIKEQIKKEGAQVFIVCPFIEESENMQTIKAATKEFEHLQKDVFSDFHLGLLHGKMKGKEKDAVLQDFKDKKIDILVATPVVEVGIDIPNATIMVIEAAERFGLSQLHQLRGRVGRGEKQSYCLLFTDSGNEQTRQRLKAMETSHSGTELAELDLSIRGSGDLYGTRQHGRHRLKIASFSDKELLQKVRNEAKRIFPSLDSFPKLKEKMQDLLNKNIAPD